MWKPVGSVCRIIAVVMIVAGALVLFARVLPAGFWWFCVGAGLVAGGILLLNKCK